MKKFISTLSIAILGGFIALGSYKLFVEEPTAVKVVEQSLPIKYASLPTDYQGHVLDFTAAVESSLNTVVHIKTETMGPQSVNPWIDMFHQGIKPQMMQSSGSGVIISQDGYIVTNNHVIDHANRIQVTLNDNRTVDAEVIGADPAFDLALLKIDEEDLPFATFGDSDGVRIGEWVLAVGNPFNLTSTVTAGIVSAKGRNINILDFDPNREIFPVESFIQTDAAVNPGNSGGALVNTRGELIGINTAIASRTGSYSGYSFAVPSSIVQKVTHDLLEFGNVQRAYIGVSIAELNQELADRLGIEDVAGVYVRGLTEGGAAAIVGIREGDIIYMVAGKRVNHVPELQEHVSRYRPGDKLKVTVKRGNDLLEYDVTVTDRYGNTTVDTSARSANVRTKDAVFEVVGKQELERLNIAMGVRLSQDLNGRFKRAGIQEGFIITRINKKTIEKPEDVVSLLEPKEGGVLIEGVYPNGTVAYYGFGM
ncbi:MAG: trypsin-like peptidase domain-containing protein [Bacteroidetes bacterium]|nr:trypsin-like peptidase domain-containing protein [Bacteroidota bacterium]